MRQAPVFPPLDVPAEKIREPDTPRKPAFAVRKQTVPEVDEAPSPVVKINEPPVRTEDAPATTVAFPPVPLSPVPTTIVMLPPRPPAESPDVMFIQPLLPLLAVPVEMIKWPLTPAIPAFAVAIVMLPELYFAPYPDVIQQLPPLDVYPCPAVMAT
jgi:hypothetical protein